MRTLDRAIRRSDSVGTRIGLPFMDLDRKVKLHTKELVLVAGGPGSGKSTLAVNIAIMSGYPVLYFAQDTAPSVLARMAALACSLRTDEVYEKSQTEEGREWLAERLQGRRPTLVIQDGRQSLASMQARIEALREWLGIHPPLVVVDNLIDTLVDGTNHHDTGFYAQALPALKDLALKLDCTIMALHHTQRHGHDHEGLGTKPLKLNSLLYAGEREARHVWGLYSDQEDRMKVQILKQQDGIADADGGLYVSLAWIREMSRLTNLSESR